MVPQQAAYELGGRREVGDERLDKKKGDHIALVFAYKHDSV
jgi:hypothetical protein